jgi:flagellar protein FlaG
MMTDAVATTGNLVKISSSDSMVELAQVRKKAKEEPQQAPEQAKSEQVQPEELLTQIKALTEDGLYAVRFEKDRDLNELVVKIVDSDTNETIRQIPPQELLELTQRLNELQGNIVNTVS